MATTFTVMRRSRCPWRSHDDFRVVSQIPGGVSAEAVGRWCGVDRILACIGNDGIPMSRGTRKAGFGTPGKSGRAIFAFYSPRPPLGSLTKEMGLILKPLNGTGETRNPPVHPHRVCRRVSISRFLRSQLRRIGLGHPPGRDPWRTVEKRIVMRASGSGHRRRRSSLAGRRR